MKAGSIWNERLISVVNRTGTKRKTRSNVHLQGNNRSQIMAKKVFHLGLMSFEKNFYISV